MDVRQKQRLSFGVSRFPYVAWYRFLPTSSQSLGGCRETSATADFIHVLFLRTQPNVGDTMKTLFILVSVMIVLFLVVPNRVGGQKKKPVIQANVDAYRKLRSLSVFSAKSFATISNIAFSPDSNSLAISGGKDSEWNKYSGVMTNYPGEVVIWNINSDQSTRLTGMKSQSEVAAFSPDGRELAAGANDEIRIWDLSNSKGKSILNEDDGLNLNRLAFIADGNEIVSLRDTPKIVGLRSGSVRKIPILLSDYATYSEISTSNERLVSFTSDRWDNSKSGKISVWDLKSGTTELTFSWKGSDHTGIAVSQDGATIATSETSGELRFFDANTGKLLSSFMGGRISGVLAFSLDDQVLATGGRLDGSVLLWKIKSGKLLKTLTGNGSLVCIKFSPDGQKLAIANFREVIVWSLPSR